MWCEAADDASGVMDQQTRFLVRRIRRRGWWCGGPAVAAGGVVGDARVRAHCGSRWTVGGWWEGDKKLEWKEHEN